MKEYRFWIAFVIICIGQALLNSFLYLSPYIVLNLLPVIVMCIPLRHDTPFALAVAFAAGLAVDFISDGALGMSSAALLVTALFRRALLKMVCDEEILSHPEGSPTAHMTTLQTVLTVMLACLLFFATYSWIDSAGTRTFWFNTARTALSTVCSTALGLLIAGFVLSDTSSSWK